MKTKEEIRLARNAFSRKYYAAHRKERLAYNKLWMKNHKNYREEYTKKYSERKTVMAHYRFIFKSRKNGLYHQYYSNYSNMPFYDGWNPDKGGSFNEAVKWIVKNIGRRPKNASIHIIDHSLGFVPGNIEWTYQKKQINQQMFKIIAQQRNKIKKLEAQIMELEKVNVNCAA